MKQLMLILSLSAALAACSRQAEGPAGPRPEATPADLAAGRALAEQECQGCHGLDGRGTAPGIPNLAAQSERYLHVSVDEYVKGKRTHAALRDMIVGMSEENRRNVIAYYASLAPLPPAAGEGAPPFQPYEHGRALSADCARCHGVDGNASKPGMPSLAGQQPHYLVVAVQEYLHGVRTTDPMHSLLRQLSKLDVESIALYFASQSPAERAAPAFGNPAAGEPLTAVCGGCHGAHGVSSDAATPNLAAQDAAYLVNSIKSYRRTRRHAAMEDYVGDLSQQDIENIAAFYAVQKSRPAERGQTLVDELIGKCDRCHGADAETSVVAMPKINGQDRDYLIMALRAYRDNRRESSTMHNMSLPYSDSVIESLASHYASQPAR